MVMCSNLVPQASSFGDYPNPGFTLALPALTLVEPVFSTCRGLVDSVYCALEDRLKEQE